MLLRKPSNHKMKSRKSRRKSFSFWLYIIGVFAMRETEAAHHSHEILFTAVGTSKTLLSFTMVSFLDDVEIAFYDKKHQQLVIKEAWVSHVLGADFIEDQQYKLMHNEIDYLWALQNWVQNDTLGKKEIYCSKKVKRYLEDYCVQPMRKVLQYSNIRDNVPPEVTVSWHHAPDGNVTLSCTATGFYPSSILLHWEKDKQLVVWGQESSSGILPNIDVTFYLQITLKLQSRDMEPGYTCVVEHSELETPAMYHVPVKPAKVGPWYMTLSILAVVTMLLSCAAAFITWKKRKTESTFSGSPGSANK
ncbi:BOLA class I histocompatibility antigen, alpha chain BL3-6-like isoform X2 [Phascolarctos cinereus]|uniref:Class I histocompatibility antigen, F10 alpha chain-like isoform X2 n=1 Tax=Phascolarctos cinereus TaxID=38626 RepID=A0A6P5LFE9_PHACI|nr:class I histocompatibility antigen, F10 alpha chain-like isoform X2 [Phascolarctos cinereus]